MLTFKKNISGIEVLESPFGGLWTGIVLIHDKQNILIDSGASAEGVDNYLIPALRHNGLELSDIDYLLNSHCHGDHIGGHCRIKELSNVKIVTYRASLDKMRNPMKYSKLIRAKFPDFSPPPPAALCGVEPDILLDNGELFAKRFRLIHTPGHDNDTVCWYDEESKTLISGDSLQGHGTALQGIGFYQDLCAYRASLQKLCKIPIDNIIAGHPYIPYGSIAIGREKTQEYLKNCLYFTELYDKFINEIWNSGKRDLPSVACELIKRIGGQVPDYLFLALYTVAEHLKTRKSCEIISK